MKQAKPTVLFADDANMTLYMPEYPATRAQVASYVGRFAGRIDLLAWDCLVNGVCWYWSEVGPNVFEGRDDFRDSPGKLLAENIKALAECGANLPLAVAEECHKHGIAMLASVRMGLSMYDAKDCGIYYNARMTPQFHNMTAKNLDSSPEAPANRVNNSARNLDYSFPEVQDLILRPCEELASEFPIDGFHLNFIRGGAPFESHEAAGKGPVMTEFLARLVEMLRKHSRKRGTGKPLLAARVPNDIRYCAEIGLDVATWVNEGLVDIIIPDQVHTMIFDARVDEFTEVCKGGDVLVLPSFHPCGEQLEPAAQFRAGLDNWYRQGANGFSTFNFFFFHPHDGYSLDWFGEFREPESVAANRRIFPVMAHTEKRFDLYNIGEAAVSFRKHEVGDRKTVRFPRILAIEKPLYPTDATLSAVLHFRVGDWSWEDELEVDVDGVKLPEVRACYSVHPHFSLLASESRDMQKAPGPEAMERWEWNTYDFTVPLPVAAMPKRPFQEIGFTLVNRSNVLSDALITKIRVVVGGPIHDSVDLPKEKET